MGDLKPLLVEQTWNGTFFSPNDENFSFGGTLTFFPTHGVRLSAAIPFGESLDRQYTHLHGLTNDGTPLTVIGNLDLKKSGFRYHSGFSSHTISKYPFRYVVVGTHCENQTTFELFGFDITGAQEFFGPSVSRNSARFSGTPVAISTFENGNIEISHKGSLDFFNDDITTLMYSPNNENALKELQECFEKIKSSHPQFHPFIKKSLEYTFTYRPNQATEIIQAFEVCSLIADLLSVLYFSPARISSFSAVISDESGHKQYCPVFPTILCEQDTLDRCKEETSFYHLPINASNVNIGILIERWMQKHKEFSTLVSFIQSQGRFISFHAILSGIVLGATQLEDIAYQSGCTKDKFQYPIDNHCSPRVKNFLATTFSCPQDQIGVCISDLRNEIAHIGRPRKFLSKLSANELFIIFQALQAVVLGYVITQIGATTSARDKYQKKIVGVS